MTERTIRVEVPARFWPRLLAFGVDGVVVQFLQLAWDLLLAATGLSSTVVAVAYFWLLTGTLGRTPGKIVLGIELVGPEGRLGLGRAFLREVVGKTIGVVTLGLGFLWIAFDPQKRGWHDVIANTRAVRVTRIPWMAAWDREIAGLLADRGEAEGARLVQVPLPYREFALRDFAVRHAQDVTLSHGVLTPTGAVEWF